MTTPVKPKPKPKPRTPAKPKRVAADYGYAAAFLNAHKDVARKVALAVKQGWTPDRLSAEIKDTPWWRKRTEAQRKWDIISAENPKEARRLVDLKTEQIKQMASTMGVTLSDNQAFKMAGHAASRGSTDPEMQSMLAGMWSLDAEGEDVGQAGTTVDQLRDLAHDYGVVLDPGTLQKQVQQVLSGDQTSQGLVDLYREQAKTLYAPISDWLEKNPSMTVKDYLAPYMQAAARELGTPPDQMDLTDPKWTKVIYGADGTTPMNLDQWTKTIRSDASYGWDKTMGAKSQALQLAAELRNAFGMGQ